MYQYNVGDTSTNTQLIEAGSGAALIVNNDPTFTLWLGNTNAFDPGDYNSVPITANGYLAVDGSQDVFGCADPLATNEINTLVIPGGMSFFQLFSQLVIQGTAAGVFIYSPTAGAGNLIGSWSAIETTDKYGNAIPQGINVNQGVLAGVGINNADIVQSFLSNCAITSGTISNSSISGGTISETSITFDSSGGQLLIYSTTTTTITQTVSGTYQFPIPSGVSVGDISAWGSAAGGDGGSSINGGPGGGGGAFSRNPNYPLIGGNTYTGIVGNGGTGGSTNNSGQDGTNTSFDNNGVVADGGNAGSGNFGGLGGQIANCIGTIAFAGGNGGNATGTGSAGGGSSAGTSANGGNGGSTSSAAGGSAGTAPSGGGNGGAGVGPSTNGNGGSNPGGGGSGAGAASGVTSISKSYRAKFTYSYLGSEVGQGLRAYNGAMYQGAYSGGLGVDGDQYSFALFDYNQIRSDFSGATIDSVTVEITNSHSWYNSGCYIVWGYAPFTTYGNTGNLSGSHENVQQSFIAEGATKTFDLTAQLKSVVATSSFTSILLGPSKSTSGGAGDLWNYGIFNGGPSFGPILKVTGHIGAGSKQAGDGNDGKLRVIYSTASTLLAAISPVAGSDAAGNAFGIGWTGPVQAIQPSSNPTVAETWHNITPPTGWSGTSRYKRLAENNMVYLDIAVSASAQAAKSNFPYPSNLPSGYFNPSESMTLPLTQTNNTAKAAPDISLFISTAGLITFFHVDVGTTRLDCHESFPID